MFLLLSKQLLIESHEKPFADKNKRNLETDENQIFDMNNFLSDKIINLIIFSTCLICVLFSKTFSAGNCFNEDSLNVKLNSHYKAWGYKKRRRKTLKHTGDLFRKKLQLISTC